MIHFFANLFRVGIPKEYRNAQYVCSVIGIINFRPFHCFAAYRYLCPVKKLLKLIPLIRPYGKYVFLNVLCNFISIIFSLVSITLLIPFLQLLFNQVSLQAVRPEWSFTAGAVSAWYQYYFSQLIVQEGKFNALLIIAILVVFLFFLKNLSRYLALYLVAPMRNFVIRDLRNNLYAKVLILPLAYFTEQRKGDIISRISHDVLEVEWSVMNSLMILFRDPLAILLFVAVLFMINPLLTVLTLVLLPLTGLLINYIGKMLNRYSRRGQDKLGMLVAMVEESIHGIKIIKAFNAFTYMRKRFTGLNGEYTRLMNKVFRRRDLSNPLTEFMAILVMVALIWYGGRMVLQEGRGMHADVFLFYLAVFSQLVPPAKNLITAYYYIEKGLASLGRIEEVMQAEEVIVELPGAETVVELKECISYRDVSFSYGAEPVLKGIDLDILRGEVVAVVGPSGAGKSSLVDLLPRFYDIQSGSLTIDGREIRELRIDPLRAMFGIVSQETVLFNDTIYNNIIFGKADVLPEEVTRAAVTAYAHDFIMRTGQGYQTVIGDRGVRLSGGERQRLSLARALLRNPQVYILDEATSALDNESENLIQEALRKVLPGRTAIIIAHRLSTIRLADTIVVLTNGRIIEKGSFEDLSSGETAFARLFHHQLR